MPSIIRSRQIFRSVLLLLSVLTVQQAAAFARAAGDLTAVTPPPAEAVTVSQVRIVRLSQVNGKVLLDRGSEHGFETAFANLPIVQGSRLQTLEGLAEVEFEDNSSLRIAPNSQIDFAQLGRGPAGATTNKMTLQKGTLYLSLTKTKGNDFNITVGGKDISLPPASHIRLDVYPDGSELAVLHGKVLVTDALSHSTWTVGTEKAFKFSNVAAAQPVLFADDRQGLYDAWDKTQADYHNGHVPSAFAGTAHQYGINDLNYYGSFTDIAGCGQLWQPYFTSASWNPFSTGVWAWYPGTGYSWVSPYPWGWMPFHSGNWISCPNGAGWGWRPGNNWTGVNNAVALHPTRGPKPPLKPIGRSGLVVVGANLVHASRIGDSQKFEFAKDSAGLGVPRDMPVKLQKMSSELSARGTAQARIETPTLAVVPRTGNQALNGNQQDAGVRSSIAAERSTSRPLAPITAGAGMVGARGQGIGYSPSGPSNSAPISSISRSPVSASPSAGASNAGKSH